ncbi:hypothetical protein ACLGIH_18235 [Streptomyces sp. HMX87]|uniref:SCO4225 family membrane protein n=1 Tax=Streptomyces sp. HMX87 TaxID=3390849 RepID=UPI003A887959
MNARPNARTIRTFARLAFANPASAVSLGVVGAAVAVAVVQPLVAGRPDASLGTVLRALRGRHRKLTTV